MNIQFSTCEPHTALEYLKALYPSYEITKENSKEMLDLVREGTIRIGDPKMHNGAVFPSTNWTNGSQERANEAMRLLHERIGI